MKFLTVIVSFLMLTGAAFAEAPVAATTVKALSSDAMSLARALVHPAIAKQVAQFSADVDLIESGEVDEQDDSTVFTLQGVIFVGGDVVCGRSTMTIKSGYAPSATGWGVVSTYTATVVTEKSRCP